MIQAGEIYLIPKGVRIGNAEYARPCLVLRVSKSDASVCYFSTKMEYRDCEVALFETDPDFKESGLRAASFIIEDSLEDVKLEFFDGAKRWGRASGEFKRQAEEWYGMPIG